jgi:NADH:ubiquinone reductase (non-electrogenic)
VPLYTCTCACANSFSSSAALSGKCENSSVNTERKKLVILGTGWGSYSVVLKANKKLYDVIVISPRNHFLFTPLLASTTVGTLEFRSIIEPIRNSGFRDEHHFHQSYATGLDPDRQVVRCVSALDPGMSYEVGYDVLVIGVGAVPNDFNIPGVKEHAYFLKV